MCQKFSAIVSKQALMSSTGRKQGITDQEQQPNSSSDGNNNQSIVERHSVFTALAYTSMAAWPCPPPSTMDGIALA